MNQHTTEVKDHEINAPTVNIQPVGAPEPVSLEDFEIKQPLPSASEVDSAQNNNTNTESAK